MGSRKIKSLMILKGITSASIADKEGVSRTWVSLVLNGKKKSSRISASIATAIGVPVEKLWSKAA